jgi:hypothetical protein
VRELLVYSEPRRIEVPDRGHTTTDLIIKFRASSSAFPAPYELRIKAGTPVGELAQNDFVVDDLSKVEWIGNGPIQNWSILLSDANIYGIRVPRSCVMTVQEIAKKKANLESYIAMTRDQLGKAMDRDELSALEYVLAEAIEELEDLNSEGDHGSEI